MKKSSIIFLSLVFLFLAKGNIFAIDNIEQAKRYLKLANTFLQTNNTDEAMLNYNKAKEILMHNYRGNTNYWDAVSDETLGNIYLKLGNLPLAKLSYQTALNKYKKILDEKGNSPEAIKMILESIDDNNFNINMLGRSNTKIVSLDNSKKVTQNLILPKSVEAFSCVNCKLSEIPQEIYNSPNLKRVTLNDNKIKQFNINKMTKLEYLDLSKNKIKTINGNFSELPNLQYLNLADNSLKDLPTSIFELKNLKVLNLKGNKIPFSFIKTLIQNMPNTLIINDDYQKVNDIPEINEIIDGEEINE
jgi:Leucine-rich repeat (LRR) protein